MESQGIEINKKYLNTYKKWLAKYNKSLSLGLCSKKMMKDNITIHIIISILNTNTNGCLSEDELLTLETKLLKLLNN